MSHFCSTNLLHISKGDISWKSIACSFRLLKSMLPVPLPIPIRIRHLPPWGVPFCTWQITQHQVSPVQKGSLISISINAFSPTRTKVRSSMAILAQPGLQFSVSIESMRTCRYQALKASRALVQRDEISTKTHEFIRQTVTCTSVRTQLGCDLAVKLS